MKYLISALTITFLYACGSQKQEPEKNETPVSEATVSLSPDQMKNAQIQTGKAELNDVSSVLRLSGSIDVPPQNMVSICFPLGGYLKSSQLLPGMQVRKGQVLAVVEDAQFVTLQQDYLVIQARLATLQAEYQRQQELNASKASSDKNLQQAKSEYETQRITYKALAEKLRLIGIDPDRLSEDKISRSVPVYSPIQGFVSKVNVNIGKYVSPTEVLFELVNTDDIHLSLTAFEKDVAKLAVGQRVIAYTNGDPEKKYPASILLITRDLDENRTAEIHCHFDKYDKNLLPGMFMNAEVAVKTENAWLVPESAVVRWQNRHYIFLDQGEGMFQMEPVEIGLLQNGKQQIFPKTDLSNRNIAVQNAYSLLMKMKNSAEE